MAINLVSTEPMSGSAMSILMLLSTLQYQAPGLSSTYSAAASQAGKAAYVQLGGQAMQDKLSSDAEAKAKSLAKSTGMTDSELGLVLVTAKIAKDHQVDLNGPKLYFIKTHFTFGQDHGSIGLGINF